MSWAIFDIYADAHSDDAEATKRWARVIWPDPLQAFAYYAGLLEEQRRAAHPRPGWPRWPRRTA